MRKASSGKVNYKSSLRHLLFGCGLIALLLGTACSSGLGGSAGQEPGTQSLATALKCSALKQEECSASSSGAAYTAAGGVTLTASGHTDKYCWFSNGKCIPANRPYYASCNDIQDVALCPNIGGIATVVVGAGNTSKACVLNSDYDSNAAISSTNQPCKEALQAASPNQKCRVTSAARANAAIDEICAQYFEDTYTGTGKINTTCSSIRLDLGEPGGAVTRFCKKGAGGVCIRDNDAETAVDQLCAFRNRGTVWDPSTGKISQGYASAAADDECNTKVLIGLRRDPSLTVMGSAYVETDNLKITDACVIR
jgi:hypothetical protein